MGNKDQTAVNVVPSQNYIDTVFTIVLINRHEMNDQYYFTFVFFPLAMVGAHMLCYYPIRNYKAVEHYT